MRSLRTMPPADRQSSARRDAGIARVRVWCREFEHARWTREPFQDEFTTAVKPEASLDAQIVNEVRRQNPPGSGGVTYPAGQRDRRPEQVVVMVDGLAGRNADPHPKLCVRAIGRSCVE